MHLTPTAGFQNINFDIWKKIVEGGLYKYPIKNISRTVKFLPTFSQVKGIARVFNWLKWLGGIMHLTPTAGCQNINFDIWKKIVEGGLYKYPIKNISRTVKFLPTFSQVKGIGRVFYWLKCLGGIMHLKPTAGCQISIPIFEKNLWRGGLYKYPMKNISRTAKFLPTFS
jgi:hypothetical protein